KRTQRDGYREGGDGVSGRERKLVGRQQVGPAMRLDFTRTFAAGQFFQQDKDADSGESRRAGGGDGGEAAAAAEQQNGQPDRIPPPALPGRGGSNFEERNRAGGRPFGGLPQQFVSAGGDD